MTAIPSEGLWQAFEPRLRAYVRARVDASAADDVVADILLRLIRHPTGLERARKPVSWVMRVASNAITDHHRRRAAEQRLRARAADDSSSTEPDGESVTESHAELAQCLAPLIHGLAEKYSEALRLTEVEGLTQAAAAARLGLPPSTMKSRVQRGRARLKQALLTCCEVEVDRRGGVVEYAERAGRDDCPGC